MHDDDDNVNFCPTCGTALSDGYEWLRDELKARKSELELMKVHHAEVDGIKRGQVRCELCHVVYELGMLHGCKTSPPLKGK